MLVKSSNEINSNLNQELKQKDLQIQVQQKQLNTLKNIILIPYWVLILQLILAIVGNTVKIDAGKLESQDKIIESFAKLIFVIYVSCKLLSRK